MPRKYRKVPKLHLRASQVSAAAEAIAPLARSVAEHVASVAIQRARDHVRGTKRPRGRGSQLSSFEQLAVMMYAVAIEDRPAEIAAALGFDARTVRRVLGTVRFKRFTAAVDAQVADAFSSRRFYLHAQRFLQR